MYIAEIAPQNLRGRLGSVNQVTVFNGLPFFFLLDGQFYSEDWLQILFMIA